jgi:hypothetical protein
MRVYEMPVALVKQGALALDLANNITPRQNWQVRQFQVAYFLGADALAPERGPLMDVLQQIPQLRFLPILTCLSSACFDGDEVDDPRQDPFWVRIAECHRLLTERSVVQRQL